MACEYSYLDFKLPVTTTLAPSFSTSYYASYFLTRARNFNPKITYSTNIFKIIPKFILLYLRYKKYSNMITYLGISIEHINI